MKNKNFTHGQVNMIRPHLNDIPEFSPPDGCGFRPMTLEDIDLWTDIQRDAEKYISISDDTFISEFGDDPHMIGRRCFIVTDPDGEGIGVASAWCNSNFRGLDYGRVHWIAIRPYWQGIGLGKATLSYVMQKLAQWHERAYLVTHTQRIAAVKMYLNFGFEPDLVPSSAFQYWKSAAASIRHPLLERVLKKADKA